MAACKQSGMTIVVLLAFILVMADRASCQQSSGSIEGRVSDSQQLALAQPTVELQDAQGRTLQQVIGDGAGHYTLVGVAAGSYTVQFGRTGFATLQKENVVLAAGQTVVLDAVLQPQEISQFITVTASVDDDRLVASKSDIPLRETPVTVQTVPLEVIQRQAATDLVAVVNNLPGAYAMTRYGVYNYFVFRGFQIGKDPGSALLLNGLRVEGNRVNSQVNSIESVQVLKGPASMLYGTEATGGTINIVQKKPLSTAAYEFGVHGGRWGNAGIDFGATGPLRTDKLLYRLDVAFERSNGFRGAGYDRFNVTPSVFWRITQQDQLDVRITYDEDRYDLDAGIPLQPTPQGLVIPAIPLDRRFNTPENFEKLSNPLLQGFYTHSFSDNVRFRQAFSFQYQGDAYFQSEGLTIGPSTPRTVDRDYLFFNHYNRSLVAQSDVLARFDWLWRHQVLIGYEYDRFAHNTKRSAGASNTPIPSIDLFDPVETATPVTSFPASRYDLSLNQSHAIYFQDYVRLHPKVQVLVGGRYDGYDRKTRRGLAPQVHFEQSPFTYRVALNAQVAPVFSLYTSYGTTFEAQTALAPTGATLDPQTG